VNDWQTLQQNYRTWNNEIRWPHTSNILHAIFCFCSLFLTAKFQQEINKERNLLEIFVKEQCFENKRFDNKKWKELSSVMDQPKYLNVSKTICHLGRPWTWNFFWCYFESLHWVMPAFWPIDMCKDWTKSSQCCTKCAWFSKSLSEIYPLLQQTSGELISFSTTRHNVCLIQFNKCRYLLQ